MSLIFWILPRAKKQLAKLGKKQRKQQALISKALYKLQTVPFPPESKKLKGKKENGYRYDVGDYRIIYTLTSDVMTIAEIKIRDDNTYKNRGN